jgi:excisionase family DNA binding protein
VNKLDGISIIFLPSGKPAPAVLTAEEAAEFLRLDGKNPDRTLKYWRDEGELAGFRLGRRIRYRLEDVLSFLAKKAENTLQKA